LLLATRIADLSYLFAHFSCAPFILRGVESFTAPQQTNSSAFYLSIYLS
jgi:hypothetical protein